LISNFSTSKSSSSGDFQKFLLGEVRYSSLKRTFPDEAEKLFKEAEEDMKERYNIYKWMAEKPY